MKKLLGIITALLMSVGIFVGVSGVPAQADTLGPVIFFVPHQDDEVYTFGPEIITSLAAGRDVIEVLMTDGSSTGVCANGNKADGDFYRNADGDPTDYTVPDRNRCTKERDSEFENAALAFNTEDYPAGAGTLTTVYQDDPNGYCGGLPAGDGHNMEDNYKQLRFSGDVMAGNENRPYGEYCVDNHMTEQFANWAVQKWVDEYGPQGASFKAMSYKEMNHCDRCANNERIPSQYRDQPATVGGPAPGEADHGLLGYALSNATGTADKRYFIKPPLWYYYDGPNSHWGNRHILDDEGPNGTSDEIKAYLCGRDYYSADRSNEFPGTPLHCVGGQSISRDATWEQTHRHNEHTTSDDCYPNAWDGHDKCYNDSGADVVIQHS